MSAAPRPVPGMLARDHLALADALPVRDLDAVLGPGGVLVVAPHADDESLGVGGTVAEARARGREVAVALVSDGTGSHPGSRAYPPPRLRALREAELRHAVGHLGVPPGRVVALGLPDRFVPSAGPAAEAAAGRLAALAREVGATAILVTWEHDPHCDHAAAAALARRAAELLAGEGARPRLLAYPVWGHRLPAGATVPGGPPRGARIEVARHRAAKRRAVLAHRSQTTRLIADDPDGFVLDAAMLAHHDRDHEALMAMDGATAALVEP